MTQEIFKLYWFLSYSQGKNTNFQLTLLYLGDLKISENILKFLLMMVQKIIMKYKKNY